MDQRRKVHPRVYVLGALPLSYDSYAMMSVMRCLPWYSLVRVVDVCHCQSFGTVSQEGVMEY